MVLCADVMGNSGLQAWRLRPEQPVLRDARMLWWSCDLNLGFLTSGLVLVPLIGLSAFWDNEVDFHYFADLCQAPRRTPEMDFLRLARLLSSPCPVGLSIVRHLDPLRARWAGGRAAGWVSPAPAAFSSSLSQLPLGSQSQKNTGSLSPDPGQPSPTATQEEGEEESFGTLSDKYSSRRMFHKSTAQLYNLRLKEQNTEEDEEGELEPKPWRGPRNTPYWYFFQCKRLIREGKVGNLWTLLLPTPASAVPVFCEGLSCCPGGCSGLLSPLCLHSPQCCLRRPSSPLASRAPSSMPFSSSCYQPSHPTGSPSLCPAASSPSPLHLPLVAWNSCSQPQFLYTFFISLIGNLVFPSV